MFSPAPMVQIRAMVLRRDERSLLYGLGQAGVVHLSRATVEAEDMALEPLDTSSDLARCDDLLRRIEQLIQSYEIQTAAVEGDALATSLDKAAQRLEEIEQVFLQLSQQRSQLQRQWGQAASLAEQFAKYEQMELPLEEIRQSKFLHFAIGSLPAEKLEELRENAADNVVLLALNKDEDRQPVVAVTSRKGRFALETALGQAGFQRQALAAEPGQDAQVVAEEARSEQARLAQKLDQIEQCLSQRVREFTPELSRMEQAVREERAILEAQQNFLCTDTAVLITCWTPADKVKSVQRQLEQLTAGRYVIRFYQADEVPLEQVPILLRQPSWLRPFGALVTGYGLPGYRDIEPTLFVAISYVLMFGIMFGDVGHGGLLAIGGLAAMLFSERQKIRDSGLLVLAAGMSSLLFGVVYGSYFGIPALHGLALWHDPLDAPVRLMVATVGVGIAIVSLGTVLNMINAFRRGEFMHAVLDKFGLAGMVFYWGSLVFLVKYATLSELGVAGIALVLLIVLPLLALAIKDPLEYALSKRAGRHPHSDNIFMAFIESAIEAFEAVLAYLANTISFVRLAAYAMSHAAILMATFAVAEAVSETPAVGGVLYVLIAIVGNLIALVLEGVVVAVQVLRLEYYEFFGKFFTGTGLAFRPFSFLRKDREIV